VCVPKQVQRDIREGHAVTVDKVLNWIGDDLKGITVCDAGCGTGSLSIPLALRGANVYGSDISEAMVRRPTRDSLRSLGTGWCPFWACQGPPTRMSMGACNMKSQL
jgi:magnesium-protoporphyrin O-methyltransferase